MSADGLREYEVELRATVSRRVTIQATSHHEAAALVKARHGRAPEPLQLPGRLSVEEVRLNSVDEGGLPCVEDEWEIFGWCESCGVALFCDDDVGGDGEVYLCAGCHDKAVEAAREEGSQ